MNYIVIADYLTRNGYQVKLTEKSLRVTLDIGSKTITLTHYLCSDQYLAEMPIFWIEQPRLLGQLAHIGLVTDVQGIEYGSFCVNTPDSVSINFEMPELVFRETLERYENRLREVLLDEQFNREERIREFQASWWHITDKSKTPLLSTSKNGAYEFVDILKPILNKNVGFGSYCLAHSKNTEINMFIDRLSQYERITNRKVFKGFVLSLCELNPAPISQKELPEWYATCIEKIKSSVLTQFNQDKSSYKAREFWVIFNAPTPSGTTWFAVYLQSRQKRELLPTTVEDLDKWQITAIPLVILNKELLLPRSGGDISLCDKRALLVGAGSVGGEIAEKLGKTGIGKLDVVDPDIFLMDNLYRHTLNIFSIQQNKAQALSVDLSVRNPWLESKWGAHKLLDQHVFKLKEEYDIVIIAIGNPTHERLFFKKLKDNNVHIPTIYTWVEGYGIGGHAVLSIPNQQGCLYCAYIDIPSRTHGLNSNLNFLQPNQDLTVNHGGCGNAFLPYSGLAASQTAIMASDLAIKFLLGEVNDSAKISWKGSNTEALKRNLALTDRYHLFEQSLQLLPLHNTYCDLCHE